MKGQQVSLQKHVQNRNPGHIILVYLCDINKQLPGVLEREIKRSFDTDVEIRFKPWNLNFAYNKHRKKYSSAQLLRRLRQLERRRGDKILGIVDVDIYSPGWEFIFGEAEINSSTAIISLFLLKPEHNSKGNDDALFKKRAVKEAIHELGHLYGHGHCLNNKCVMFLSKSLGAIDRKNKIICETCRN